MPNLDFPKVQDDALVEEEFSMLQPSREIIGPTSLNIQEPSLVAELNLRLFTAGVLSSLAASAAFTAVQSLLSGRERAEPAAPAADGIATRRGGDTVLTAAIVLWLAWLLRRRQSRPSRSS